MYAEIIQESDRRPLEGVPKGAGGLSRFVYGILPVIYADTKHYTSYRFECALRSSAILGFIGLPTLGFHLETAFREGIYSEAWALLYAFYILIASLKYWLKPRLVSLYVVASFVLLSRTITVSWENIVRFFTYDLLPWPMRREGVLDGTHEISFAWEPIARWASEIFAQEGWEGIWNTVVLTQIVLVGTGIFALLSFPIRVPTFLRQDRQSGFALRPDCCPHHAGVYPRIYPCAALGTIYAPGGLGDSPA